MRTIKPTLLLFIALYVLTTNLMPADQYTWTPDGTQSGTAGGSGAWNQTGTNWWDGSEAVAKGANSNTFGSGDADAVVNFYGSGTIVKEGLAYFASGPASANPRTQEIRFGENSNYTFLGADDNTGGITSNGGNIYIYINVPKSSSLTLGGNGNIMGIYATAAYSGKTILQFMGGGVVNLKSGALVRQSSPNGRTAVMHGTTLNFETGSILTGGNGSFTNAASIYPRLYIENGIVNVNGGVLYTGYRSSVAIAASTGYGVALGWTTSGNGGVLNINSGTVVALGDPRDTAPGGNSTIYGGIAFASSSTTNGGILNLNGGTLVTSNIHALDNAQGTAILNLNGGVVQITTEESPGFASGAGATDEQLQNRLDYFIKGFSGANGTRYVNADIGGAIFDTSLIDATRTNGIATIRASIRGVGGLEKRGENTLFLAMANTYAGATLVSGGTLRLGEANAIATSVAVQIELGATLDFFNSQNLIYNDQLLQNIAGLGTINIGDGELAAHNTDESEFGGAIVGSGAVIKTGTGALKLTAQRSFGDLTISEGSLIGNAASLQGAITNNSTVIFEQSSAATHSGIISGVGSLEKTGAGELTLASASTYTGITTITEGVLKAGIDGVFASSAALTIGASGQFSLNSTIQNVRNLSGAGEAELSGGELRIESIVDTTYAGYISGSGKLVKLGAGRLDLTGSNSYTNGTQISEGTLAGNDSGLQGNIDISVASAELLFEQNDAGNYDGVLSGLGKFTKDGAGMLGISGNSSGFSGTTTVNDGFLMLSTADSQLGGVTKVNSGAVIGGIGTIKSLEIAAGGLVQVGLNALSAGSLVVGDTLAINNGTLAFDLYQNNVSDMLNVGVLSASGNNIVDITTFATGTFYLGDNLGGLTSSSELAIKGVLVSTGLRQSGVLSDDGGRLKLVTTVGASLNLVWTGMTDNLWNTTSSDWSGTGDDRFADRDHVTFSGASSQSIAIDSVGVIVSEMVVEGSGNYEFTGGGITGDGTIVYGDAVLTGTSGKLIKRDTGRLVLNNGRNDFRGGVDLTGGVLALGGSTTLGTGTITIGGNATKVETLGDIALPNVLDIGAYGTTFETMLDVTAELSGSVKGVGVLEKTGDGTLVLSASNTHNTTRLTSGTVAVTTGAALGGTLSANGAGTVRIDAQGLDLTANFDLGSAGASLDTQEYETTLSGSLNGSNALTKTGTGSLLLVANNIGFTGTLAINQGSIQVNADTALGQAALSGSGELIIASDGDFVFASAAGNGKYNGTVSVYSGNLTLDSAALDVMKNTLLRLNSSTGYATVDATGTVSALDLDGGTLRIAMTDSSPANMLTVETLSVTSGNLAVSVAVPSTSGEIINPAGPPDQGLFDFDISTGMKLVSALNVEAGSVGTTLNLTQMDGSVISSPIFVDVKQDGQTAAHATYNYNATTGNDGIYLTFGITELDIVSGKILILDNEGAGKSSMSAMLTGDGGIEVRATGTITLNNAKNDFTGVTNITKGTLQIVTKDAIASSSAVTIAGGAALDAGGKDQQLNNLSGAGDINMGAGSLIIKSDIDTSYSGNIESSASATLAKRGSGELTMSGVSTHGDTIIEEGRLKIQQVGALGSGDVVMADTASLTFDNIHTYTKLNKHILASGSTGGSLSIKNSRIGLSGSNMLTSVTLSGDSYVVAATSHALGGRNSAVAMDNASTLEIGASNVFVDSLVVDGGTLLFSDENSKLVSQRNVTFSNNATVGLAGFMDTGVYRFISATDGIVGALGQDFGYSPYQHGINLIVAKEGSELVFYVVNNTVSAAKDAAMTFDTIMASTSALYGRISESFIVPLSDCKICPLENGFWIKGFGASADYEEANGLTGFEERIFGIMAGYDKIIGKRLLAGGWVGMSDGGISTSYRGKTDSDQQMFGLYSSLRIGRFYLAADVFIGMLQTDIQRMSQEELVYGDYKGDLVGVSTELSCMLLDWTDGFLKPSWSVHFMKAKFKDHQESGPGAMRMEDFSQERTQSLLRLQASQQFTMPWKQLGVVDILAGWRQNIRGNDCDVNMSFVSDPNVIIPVKAGGYARGSAMLGLGVRVLMTKKLMISLNYDYEVASKRQRHTIVGSLRWMW